MEYLILWIFAGIGCYHLYYRWQENDRRQKFMASSVRNHANQLRYVSSADFYKKKIMSKDEYKIFASLEKEFLKSKYRVFSQVSLGEIIGSKDTKAYESINSKRVDILVVDAQGYAVAAVEYQGGEHYQGNAPIRDFIKKEALRKAEVIYVECDDVDKRDNILNAIKGVIGS